MLYTLMLILIVQGNGNEDKNEVSDNGDDSSVNIQQDEELKMNDFDWTALDNVIEGGEGGKNKEDSDNEKSVDLESK